MNSFEDFLKAVRVGMANKVANQISLPVELLNPATAMSAKFYAGVPVDSLHEYLQLAAEKEDYALCALIQDELNRRLA